MLLAIPASSRDGYNRLESKRLCEKPTYKLSLVGSRFSRQGGVPHISLVFREMWDTTALSLWTLDSSDSLS
jgi:hypothetical protein